MHKKLALHRIVYRVFMGKLDETLTINHKNGIKNDNSVQNLELVTQGVNNEHRFQVLKHKPSIRKDRLNFEIAEAIRADQKTGMTYKQLREKYGISKGHISGIINNKIWTQENKEKGVYEF